MGSYGFQAQYTDDANYTTSLTGACEPFTVAATPLTPAAVPKDGSRETGATVHDTATLPGQNSNFVATGTCGNGTLVGSADTVTITSTGTVPDSTDFGPLGGTYDFVATFNPTGGNYTAGATSGSEPFTLEKGSSTVATPLKNADGNTTIADGSSVPLDTSVYVRHEAAVAPNPSGSTWTFSVFLGFGHRATVTFSAVVSATDTATVVNTATITDGVCTPTTQTTAPSARPNAAVVVQCSSTVSNPVAVLGVVKSSTPAFGSTVALGSTVTYDLVLTNAGTAAATGITVTDALDKGITYVASSATCDGVTGCSPSEANNTVTWTGITARREHPTR